jgi:hypothetical protein
MDTCTQLESTQDVVASSHSGVISIWMTQCRLFLIHTCKTVPNLLPWTASKVISQCHVATRSEDDTSSLRVT